MAHGLPYSLSRSRGIAGAIRKKTYTLRDQALQVDGLSGVGFGAAAFGDFPEGNILFLGAVAYIQPTTESTDVTADYEGDYAIGTVPTVDADVGDSGEADIIPSTALAAATARLSPRTRGVQSDGAFCGVIFDNTDGSLELNLNLLIDDADISADDVDFTIDGTVHIAYIVLGDD